MRGEEQSTSIRTRSHITLTKVNFLRTPMIRYAFFLYLCSSKESLKQKYMLTIKQITENTDEVIRGLEKKHFKDAKQVIAQVVEMNNKRRSAQNSLDKNLAEVNSLSKTIGSLMKEGKKDESSFIRRC